MYINRSFYYFLSITYDSYYYYILIYTVTKRLRYDLVSYESTSYETTRLRNDLHPLKTDPGLISIA